MSGPILVVDGDDARRWGVAKILEDEGFTVSFEDDWSVPHRSPGAIPSLVVVDPDSLRGKGSFLAGFSSLGEGFAAVPVIALAASSSPPISFKIDATLAIPVKKQMLLQLVEQFLGPPEKRPTRTSQTGVDAQTRTSTDVAWGSGDVASRILTADWSRTPLGPIESWPSSLRTILRVMLNSRYAMWLGWGPDLHFFYNDAYAQQTLGIKHPGALGKTAREVWAEVWNEVSTRIEQVFRGQATWDAGLLLLLERSGYPEETYHTFSYSPAPGDHGEIAGMLCVVNEETNRVIGERHINLLRELAARVGTARTASGVFTALEQTLTENTHDFPFSLTYMFENNGTQARMASRSPVGFAPSVIPELATPDELETLFSVRDLLEVHEPRVVALPKACWPKGPWKLQANHCLIVPIVPPGAQQAIGLFIAGLNPHRPIDDVTQTLASLFVGQLAAGLSTAHAYELERRKAEVLAEIDQAKTAFFSNVSHEFRTPLTLMLGPAQDLLSGLLGPLEEPQRNQVEVIQRNGSRLQKLVNTLLDFSRMEAGGVQPTYVQVDLGLFTRQLIDTFAPAIHRAGLELEINCETFDQPTYVDVDMWEKIVLNLLSNALKFTFNGKISVSLRRKDGHAQLQVSDTGVGIPAEQIPHVFSRFHRVEGARARTHEGSGIGLALIQELCKLHAGRVEVTSTLGSGTTFLVTIPLGAEHLPDGHFERSARPAVSPGTALFLEEALQWMPSEPTPHDPDVADAPVSDRAPPSYRAILNARPKRVLLADDNADMREYVRAHLERHWEVEVAEDGLKALAIAQATLPDLIVTDIMMPGLNGFQLLSQLRTDDRTRAIPVVMLSARTGEDAKLEGLAAGAEDYLVKPFSARELVARIQNHLEIAGIRRAIADERDRLAALLGQAPAIINFLKGPDLILEYAHPSTIEKLGGRDVIGKPLLEAIPEFRGQEYPTLLRRVMQTGEPIEGREQLVLIDDGKGQLRETFWTFAYLPIRDVLGRVEGVMTFDLDVTDQVLARRQVQELDERYRQLVDQVQAGIAEVDLNGKFVFANERYRDIVSLSENELLERRVQDITHPEDRAAFVAQFQELIESGTPFIQEKRYARPNGTLLWAQDSVSKVQDVVGNTKGAALVTIDITKRKYGEEVLAEINRERQARLEEMERAVRFSEMFAGILGHDLRTPLSAIVSAASFMQMENLPDSSSASVNRILSSATRMGRMISQLLDFTRIRLGRGLPLDQTRIDLSEVVASIVDELDQVYEGRIVVSRSGCTIGSGDRDRLGQLISNLLANACQHSSHATPIEVTLDGTSPDVVRVRVWNRGTIAPEVLPVIFEPLRRAAHLYDRRGSSGLGLGLYISQQIVTAHGGSIHVESNDHDGTCFSFELPRSPVHLDLSLNRTHIFSHGVDV